MSLIQGEGAGQVTPRRTRPPDEKAPGRDATGGSSQGAPMREPMLQWLAPPGE